MSKLEIKPEIIGSGRAPYINSDSIIKIAEPLLIERGLDGSWIVECSFVSSEEIHLLNKQAQGKDEPTDVLSFPVHFATNEADPHQVLPERSPQVLGSIVIATDVAAAQAPEHSHSTEEEVQTLIEHGIHHLLGEDHDDTGTWQDREKHHDFHRRNDIVRL